jgi:hypothetical protein
MKDLFYYVFYRTSQFYEEWESNGYIGGSVVTFSSIGFITMSILIFILYFFDKKISINMIWVIVIITSILSFFLTKKKYVELAEKYKGETNSNLKGWLVFSYIVCSVVLFFTSMLLCGYWVSVKV